MPAQLDDARPLIGQIAGTDDPDATVKKAGTNAEGAYVRQRCRLEHQAGSVPQYRTQSDNLIPPEASCNMTSLAMALETDGLRSRKMRWMPSTGELRQKYLDEQKAKLGETKGDPSTLQRRLMM